MSSHVFISYGRGDREIVAAIARRLEERGLSVWYDAREALVARGVLPRRWHGPQGAPEAFPIGFAPDP